MNQHGNERRAFPRLPARESRVWLGCWVEEGFEVEAVAVLNISRGGLAVEMEYEPSKNQSVWLRIHGDAALPTVEARVVDTGPGVWGRHRTRLQFSEPCPEEFYLAVSEGIGRTELPTEQQILSAAQGVVLADPYGCR